MNRGFDKATIERVARMYKSNQEACAALGITLRSFGRLCRKYGVETPWVQKRRARGTLGPAPVVTGGGQGLCEAGYPG